MDLQEGMYLVAVMQYGRQKFELCDRQLPDALQTANSVFVTHSSHSPHSSRSIMGKLSDAEYPSRICPQQSGVLNE